MKKNKKFFLVKKVVFTWKKFSVIDEQYSNGVSVYWSNNIYLEKKLLINVYEESNQDKSPEDLRKELFKYLF